MKGNAGDLPTLRTPVPGPRSRALSVELRRWEAPHVTYVDPDGKFPIFWERGHGCLVEDVDGNRLLDLTAAFGVAALGHGSAVISEAVTQQADRLVHGMGDVHPTAVKVELARRVADFTPTGLDVSQFGSSGGDAVEIALKTARLASGKPGIVAFTGGYHGLNLGALSVTHRSDFRAPFGGWIPEFASHLPYGQRIDRLPDGTGAVLVEPIQGRGGVVVPPKGWLAHLRELCDREGALLIVDEIFTGWGRTGTWFAVDREDVVPDLMCVGKALGGGLPLSACVGRREVMDTWGESTGEALHTSTFLGNPLACAAGLAVLDRLEALGAPGRAEDLGGRTMEMLAKLAARRPKQIREVRGRGLMLGVELVDPAMGPLLATRLLAKGLIALPAGDGSVLEITPPLIIEFPQLEWAVSRIEEALEVLE